nr:MAG: capsid protein [Skomarfal virus 55]
MPRRRSNAIKRRPNRPRRMAARKSRIGRGLGGNTGASNKVYTYNFSLGSQLIRSGLSNTEPPVNIVGAAAPWSAAANFSSTASQSTLPFTYDVGFAGVFKLNDIQNFAAFTPMYDQYRINKITLELEDLTSPSYSPGVSVGGVPGASVQPLNSTVYLAVDYDDAAVPSVVANIQRRQGVRKLTANTGRNRMRITFKPSVIVGVEQSLATLNGAAINKKGMWLDCSNASVNHYGLKGWISDFLSTGQVSQLSCYRMTWSYNVSFRQPILTT